MGSARQVLLWCRQEGLTLPVVKPDGLGGVQVQWRLPRYGPTLRFLQNPIYAGATASAARARTCTSSPAGPANGAAGASGGRSGSSCSGTTTSPILPGTATSATSRCWRATPIGAMAKGAVRRGESLVAGFL